jgi:hypothetical protein
MRRVIETRYTALMDRRDTRGDCLRIARSHLLRLQRLRAVCRTYKAETDAEQHILASFSRWSFSSIRELWQTLSILPSLLRPSTSAPQPRLQWSPRSRRRRSDLKDGSHSKGALHIQIFSSSNQRCNATNNEITYPLRSGSRSVRGRRLLRLLGNMGR